MGIIPYQAFFFCSVLLAFGIGRRLRSRRVEWWWAVPTGWVAVCTLWTIVNIFMPALALFQLGVIYAAVFVSLNLMKQTRLKTQLHEVVEAAKRAASDAVAEALSNLPKDQLRLLNTKQQHDEYFDDAIHTARQSLCVTSGWVGPGAMNRKRITALREATERGVHVFLAFGYRDHTMVPTLSARDRAPVEVLHRLAQETRQKPSGGRLVLAHVPVHSKILVKDTTTAAVGSKNWLSSNNDINAEHSVVTVDQEVAALLRNEVVKMCHEAEADTIPYLLGIGPEEHLPRGRATAAG